MRPGRQLGSRWASRACFRKGEVDVGLMAARTLRGMTHRANVLIRTPPNTVTMERRTRKGPWSWPGRT